MKLEFFSKYFEKYSNIKFYKYPSIKSRVVPCAVMGGLTDRRTYMTKLITAFRNFSKAPKNEGGGGKRADAINKKRDLTNLL